MPFNTGSMILLPMPGCRRLLSLLQPANTWNFVAEWVMRKKTKQFSTYFLLLQEHFFPLKLFTESVGITRVNGGWLYKIYLFERCMCIWVCVWIQVRNGSKKGIPCPFSKFIENPSRTRYFHACFHEIHVIRYILKNIGLKPPGVF